MITRRDGRRSDFANRVHAGCSGLQYAALYQAREVFQFLFDFEFRVVTAVDGVVTRRALWGAGGDPAGKIPPE